MPSSSSISADLVLDHHELAEDGKADDADRDDEGVVDDDDVDMQLDGDGDGDGDLRFSAFPFNSSSTDDDVSNFNSNLIDPLPVSYIDCPQVKRLRHSFDESSRFFHRLWTDEDEIAILRGFHEFTSQRGTGHHAHQYCTGPFYDQIRAKLQLDFTKSQLVEKLRRLRKKYRNVLSRMASGRHSVFKSPHDREIFELSCKIWRAEPARTAQTCSNGNSSEQALVQEVLPPLVIGSVDIKPDPVIATEFKSVPVVAAFTDSSATCAPDPPSNGSSNRVVEKTVRSCLVPLFKELPRSVAGEKLGIGAVPRSSVDLVSVPVGLLGDLPMIGDAVAQGKWRKQLISELEVYAKRVELVQEQVKIMLEELRASGVE